MIPIPFELIHRMTSDPATWPALGSCILVIKRRQVPSGTPLTSLYLEVDANNYKMWQMSVERKLPIPQYYVVLPEAFRDMLVG